MNYSIVAPRWRVLNQYRMFPLIAIFFVCASLSGAAAPSINFSSYFNVPNVTAAATDAAGNIYIAAGPNLLKLAPDGSLLSNTVPVPGATLTALLVDPQSRVVLAGFNKDGGFIARPPDFLTPAPASDSLLTAIDPNGAIWALAGFGSHVNLIQLSQDGAIQSTTPIGGGSTDTPADIAIDSAGSVYVTLVTNSAELPASGFQPLLNGVPGAVSYDGGGYFYPVYGLQSAINQWLLADSNTIYVATQGQGVNQSTDRGQSFTPRSKGLTSLVVNMLTMDPLNSQILYAATGNGLAKSTNGGGTWSVVPVPTGIAELGAVAVHPKNRNHVYVALGGSNCGIYRSTDAGVSWQIQHGPADFGCGARFLMDPNDVNGVFATSPTGLYALPATTNSPWRLVSALPGLSSIAADASGWYATATGGIFKSNDQGGSWTLVNPGSFTAIAAARPYVAAGTQSGTTLISADAGATWNPSMSQPFQQPVRSLLVDNGTIFAGASYKFGIWLGKYSTFDSQLLTSTFLGGSGSQTAARLAVDRQGSVTVAMETDSVDVPTTLDAAQRRPGGGRDIAITRLTPGFGLQYASYYGGSGDERIGSVRLDAQGFLYVAGSTQSTDLPVTANALQPSSRGGSESFAAVFNPSANGLVYSSCFGGSADDSGVAFFPDNRGNAILTGITTSSDLSTVSGPPFQGPQDSFIVSLNGLIGYQALGTIRNAATLMTGPIAPGSLVTIDGSYGPVSGISITFNGIAGTVVQSRDSSIDVAVPDALPLGSNAGIAVVSRNGLSQGSAQTSIVAPGLFSANHDGQGVALGTLVRIDASGNQDTEQIFQCADSCVALPIDLGDETDTLYLQLTATGLRSETDLSRFQVTVAGQPATVISVQPQGISPGLDQLTIILPRPADGFVGPAEWKIQVTVDGVASNAVSIVVG